MPQAAIVKAFPVFTSGRIVGTPGAIRAVPAGAIVAALDRHFAGDWGDVPPEDAKANDRALSDGDRLVSAYQAGGVRFWIITEADRSVTTVLLPEEY